MLLLSLRALAFRCSDVDIQLPSLTETRNVFSVCYPEGQQQEEISAKRLLHVAVMLGHAGFASYTQKRGKNVDLRLYQFLRGIDAARAALKLLCRGMLSWYAPDCRCNDRNDVYFFLEAAETRVITAVPAAHVRTYGPRLLWVHDGFYSQNERDYQLLTATAISAFQELGSGANASRVRENHNSTDRLNADLLACLKITKLDVAYHDLVRELCESIPVTCLRPY